MISAKGIAFAILALFSATHLQAAVAPENLPGMDNLAALLDATDKKTVEQAISANERRSCVTNRNSQESS